MKNKKRAVFALRSLLLLVGITCLSYLGTNWRHEKVTEIVLVTVILGLILTAVGQVFDEDGEIASVDQALRRGAVLLAACTAAVFLLAKMPAAREAEWVGATLFSEQKSGPYLYTGFVLPEDFYRRNWKFGILLNAFYDQHPSDPLPSGFFISWISRAVTTVLSHEMQSHWLINHQRSMGFGETWGPAVRAVIDRHLSNVLFSGHETIRQPSAARRSPPARNQPA